MREIEPLLHHGIIIAVPAMVGLLLKALGLVHGVSLHTWPLDVGQNLGWGGAIGGFFSAAAAAAGWPGFFKGEPPSYFNPPTGPPTPPPNFKNWSPADQKKWIQNMVQNRRENPPPQTMMQWITTGIQSISGTSDTTTAANGCTKS